MGHPDIIPHFSTDDRIALFQLAEELFATQTGVQCEQSTIEDDVLNCEFTRKYTVPGIDARRKGESIALVVSRAYALRKMTTDIPE